MLLKDIKLKEVKWLPDKTILVFPNIDKKYYSLEELAKDVVIWKIEDK